MNEEIRDELLVQELLLRRASAGVNNAVQKRLLQLEDDLKALLLRIDPAGISGPARQAARLAKLQLRSSELIREAYADARRIVTADASRIAKAAADMTVSTLRSEIP